MVKSIAINTDSKNINIVFDENQSPKIMIDVMKINLSEINSFDIKIIFKIPIVEFRSHDYVWKKFDNYYIANSFSPKVVKLKNGQIVQANITDGIWEVEQNNPMVLLWRFNPEFASPIANYVGNSNRKSISQSKNKFSFLETPALLFPNHSIDFSRSKIPFTAIACFTDHCDFDTAKNLVLQRDFFKENHIKITKGFFLNHFSKRDDNASYQNQVKELLKWKESGHELCYHSLSQSLKSNVESFEDFKQFTPPLNNIKVWIDHGFQPYNFSLLNKSAMTESEFGNVLKSKNIYTLWNYIDSGTATSGVINQFNTKHFTLLSFLKGNKDLGLMEKAQLIIKNIIFHYYNDESLILIYMNTALLFKKVFFQKNIKLISSLIKNLSKLGTSLFSVFISWNSVKNKPYRLAKYSPVVFNHNIENNEFYVFQTLEMLDFKKSLSTENIEDLIKEKGAFIAHTYFSVPMDYHSGKLFSTPTTIDTKVSENFKFLGNKIQNEEIWNPTLSELIEYWSNLKKLILDIDSNGDLFEKSNSGIQMRKVI